MKRVKGKTKCARDGCGHVFKEHDLKENEIEQSCLHTDGEVVCRCEGFVVPEGMYIEGEPPANDAFVGISETRLEIFKQIAVERTRQDEFWGGADHDSQNSEMDWVAIICVHVGRSIKRGRGEDGWRFRPTLFHAAMVKVAALAIAAMEWNNAREAERGD